MDQQDLGAGRELFDRDYQIYLNDLKREARKRALAA
jgi:hypothetical protein